MSGYSVVGEDGLPALDADATLLPTGTAGHAGRALRRSLLRLRPVERVAVIGRCIASPTRRRRWRREMVMRVDADQRCDLVALAASGAVRRVLIALDPDDGDARAAVLADLQPVDVAIDLLDDASDVQPLRRRAIGPVGRVLKAAFDRLGALVLLGLLIPIMAAIALAILIDDGGPILFRQRREGLHGGSFEIIKFRTMRNDACLGTGPVVQTMRDDGRVTHVGRVLRASSLDELPQLLNVLRGEMSLVGPRPHPKLMLTEARLSGEIMPDYGYRHRVRPGMTGWAQINGSRGGLTSAEALRRRVSLDLEYIERWSLLLDLRIMLLTPLRLIFHGGTAF